MDSLASRHLSLNTISYDEVTGKGVNQLRFEQVAVERATEYSGEDADVTLQLHRTLYPQIERDEKLHRVYRGIEMPVMEVLFAMERTGVLLDYALLEQQSRELGEKMIELERRVHQLAGQPFNLGPPQLRRDPVRSCQAAGHKENAGRHPVDRRGCACRNSRSTIRCRSCCSSTAACRS